MSDRRSEFFYGVIATVIGFLLAIGWDTWKDHRQQRQRDEAVSRAVSNDLEANLKSIDADLRTMKPTAPDAISASNLEVRGSTNRGIFGSF